MAQSVRRMAHHGDNPDSSPAERDTILYIAAMAGELKGLAEKNHVRTLTYLLDLVYQEATMLAAKPPSR